MNAIDKFSTGHIEPVNWEDRFRDYTPIEKAIAEEIAKSQYWSLAGKTNLLQVDINLAAKRVAKLLNSIK